MNHAPPKTSHPFLHDSSSAPSSWSQVGAKAERLLDLHGAGFPVPEPLAIDAAAYRNHIADMPADEPDPARWILSRDLDESLAQAILSRLPRDPGCGYAVRSSALCEDGTEHSFAGQLETRLGVLAPDVPRAVVQVWASAVSDIVRSYASRAGIDPRSVVPGVVIQPLLNPDHSGVAFGFDPTSGSRRTVAISSVRGLGEGLVSGLLDSCEFRLQEGTIETVRDPQEPRSVRPAQDGGTVVVVDGPGAPPEEVHLREIERMVRSLERRLGTHQDVEWCLVEGKLHLLQSRPATTLNRTPDLSDHARIWESANIVESYPGTSSPLTLSFVKDVYGSVYREFCRVLGVEEEIIQANAPIFQMLGSLRGRIHYDLANWYKVLSLLPGYDLNARFMEQMMGVRDRFDPSVDLVRSRRHPWVRVAGLALGLARNWFSLPKSVRQFHQRVDDVLEAQARIPLDHLTAQEIVDLYRSLERDLLDHWRAPLVNDFFAMIVHGSLRKILANRTSEGELLSNDLLRGEGGIISTEPLRSLERIASLAREIPALAQGASFDTPQAFLEKLREHAILREMIDLHLARFGDRCPGELKLESIPPSIDPTLLARDLQAWIRSGDGTGRDQGDREILARHDAEKRLTKELKGKFWLLPLVRWLVRKTRTLVRNRENLRFERTRAYGAVRRLFLALGRKLAAEGRIAHHRDVFLLSRDELFDFVEGRGYSTNLRGLVEMRRQEEATYLESPLPDERVVTRGMGGLCLFEPKKSKSDSDGMEASNDPSSMRGLGCCPGSVIAIARVVRDPATAPDLQGCILVAERTDPGWAPLFPLAKGLLVERGSLLSHSAIVAREMGIPAVVGITALLQKIQDGDLVELDGATGIVNIRSRTTNT